MGTIERTATAREELEVKEKNLNKSGDASHSKFPAKLRLPEYRRKVLRTLWLAGACWAMVCIVSEKNCTFHLLLWKSQGLREYNVAKNIEGVCGQFTAASQQPMADCSKNLSLYVVNYFSMLNVKKSAHS